MEKTCKILVAYHKPAKLIKNDVFVPIHVGRAIATEKYKQNEIDRDDYNWLINNMIGDDTGDNISNLNNHYCEMTALYWAWKNFDKLGNPDYVGLCHYRRFFRLEDFISHIEQSDIYMTESVIYPEKLNMQFSEFHTEQGLSLLKKTVAELFENDAESIEEFFDSEKLHLYNMFIMKKELFFEYAQWVFKIINQIHQTIDYENMSAYNQRYPGFCAERLLSYFVQKKYKNNDITLKEIPFIYQDYDKNCSFPLENSNPENIPIVLAADDNYTIYTGVCIESILSNSNKKYNYDFYILGEGMKPENVVKLRSVINKYDNASIKIVNITPLFDDIDKTSLFASSGYNITVYYRFFIPEIFKNFDKILYLDSDLVVNGDISELYSIDISNYYLGAVRDLYMKVWRPNDKQEDYYLNNILKLKSENDYFQAGVMLINNKKFVEEDIFKKLMDKLDEIKTPVLNDQDILNAVCQGKVFYINNDWNYDWNIENFDRNDPFKLMISRYLTKKEYESYLQSKKSPKLIHFAGYDKPWAKPSLPMAENFWKYAKKIPFYEEIIYQNLKIKIDNVPVVKFYKNFLQRLFSIKNLKMPNKTYKVITIFGIKIKFKRNKK